MTNVLNNMELNKILEDFYAIVRKKDGEDCESDSLRVIFLHVCY